MKKIILFMKKIQHRCPKRVAGQVSTGTSCHAKVREQATGKAVDKALQGGTSCDLSFFILLFMRFTLPL